METGAHDRVSAVYSSLPGACLIVRSYHVSNCECLLLNLCIASLCLQHRTVALADSCCGDLKPALELLGVGG